MVGSLFSKNYKPHSVISTEFPSETQRKW